MYNSIRVGDYALLLDENNRATTIKNCTTNEVYKPAPCGSIINTDTGQIIVKGDKVIIQDHTGQTIINNGNIIRQGNGAKQNIDTVLGFDDEDAAEYASNATLELFNDYSDIQTEKTKKEFLAESAFDLEFEHDYSRYTNYYENTSSNKLGSASEAVGSSKQTKKKKEEKPMIDFKGHKLPKPNWYIEDLHMPIFETKDAIYCNGFVLKNGKWTKTTKAFFVTLFKGGFKY